MILHEIGWAAFQTAAAFAIHEAGHLLAAWGCRIPLRAVRVTPFGFCMAFDFSRCGYPAEAAVHLAGPLAGILTAFLTVRCGRFAFFRGISLALAGLNLLPIDGLDGGGLVRCLLSMVFFPDTVWRISWALSVLFRLILLTAVLWIELRAAPNFGLLAFAIGMLLKKRE